MKSLCVKKCTIYSRHHSKQAVKNIQDSIIHMISNEIDYRTPYDRALNFYVEGMITTSNTVELTINICPLLYRNSKTQTLKKYIIFKTSLKIDDLIKDLHKEISWLLFYFGFTIMYVVKYFKAIEIEKVGKGYTIEYIK